jgi:ribose-phosphate pyrophosphokinase
MDCSAVQALDDFWVVGGPASLDLARKIAEELRARLVKAESKIFPDGESYIRIPEEWAPKYTVLVQSTCPPQDRNLIQLCLMADRLREMGSKVIAIVPYLAYARQHRVYVPGETVSIRLIARLLETAGIIRLVTIDIHNVEGLGYFTIPANSLSAVPVLAEYLKSKLDSKKCVVVAPDEGARIRVETLATQLGSEYVVIRKERDRHSGRVTAFLPEEERLDGKEAIILDDLISTGGTIAVASRLLKDRGASRVTAACTHALLAEGAMERMKQAGVEMFVATDTIPGSNSSISVSHTICEFIRRL